MEPLFLADEELQPNAPLNLRWHEQNPLLGFHVFLIGRVPHLPTSYQRVLHRALDNAGWPLHLRSMESAALKIHPGSPWFLADETVLIILRQGFKIPSSCVAQVFFEGRTSEECELKFMELMRSRAHAQGISNGVKDVLDISALNNTLRFADEDSFSADRPCEFEEN